MDHAPVRDRLRLILDHFGRVEDPGEPWRVRFPLAELLFLAASARIAGYDGVALVRGVAVLPADRPRRYQWIGTQA